MRMADADGEEAFTLKQLAREELLSEEQHLKLAEDSQWTLSKTRRLVKVLNSFRKN